MVSAISFWLPLASAFGRFSAEVTPGGKVKLSDLDLQSSTNDSTTRDGFPVLAGAMSGMEMVEVRPDAELRPVEVRPQSVALLETSGVNSSGPVLVDDVPTDWPEPDQELVLEAAPLPVEKVPSSSLGMIYKQWLVGKPLDDLRGLAAALLEYSQQGLSHVTLNLAGPVAPPWMLSVVSILVIGGCLAIVILYLYMHRDTDDDSSSPKIEAMVKRGLDPDDLRPRVERRHSRSRSPSPSPQNKERRGSRRASQRLAERSRDASPDAIDLLQKRHEARLRELASKARNKGRDHDSDSSDNMPVPRPAA